MPGYGFSGKPTSTGWGPERMARAWAELMQRLGYSRYVAQGGDWGAFVVDQMGLQAPAGLLAVHTNMPATVPADVDKALQAGDPPPSGLSAEERRAYQQLLRTYEQVEYARYMASRPQTLYGIGNSPVGLAAWLLDHNDADGQHLGLESGLDPLGLLGLLLTCRLVCRWRQSPGRCPCRRSPASRPAVAAGRITVASGVGQRGIGTIVDRLVGRRHSKTAVDLEPEGGFEPPTCQLRGHRRPATLVEPGKVAQLRRANHQGRNDHAKRGTLAETLAKQSRPSTKGRPATRAPPSRSMAGRPA